MANETKQTIRNACRILLRPIASMLLKCGMTWKEFSDLSKLVFVEAATEEYGIKGRPTNVSRVSILTGISRKEVKHQRDLLSNDEPVQKGKTTDATRLLSGWHQDPLYTDADRNPVLLPEDGEAPSFEALCHRFGGDIPMATMLKELLKTQAVVLTNDGYLRAISRYYQPAVHDDEILHLVVSMIRDLTETANNNVFTDNTSVPRFGGKADNDCIPAKAIPEFAKFLDWRGQSFLEEMDDWLNEHAASNADDKTGLVRIGVGLFAIEDKDTKSYAKETAK